MLVGRFQFPGNPAKFIAYHQYFLYSKKSKEMCFCPISESGDKLSRNVRQDMSSMCTCCRGLHAEGSCLIKLETRWQRFRSALVRLWRRIFGKIKVGPQIPRYQRALLPGEPIVRPDGRKPFPKNYDSAAEAKIAEEIGADRIVADPGCVGPVEIDKR